MTILVCNKVVVYTTTTLSVAGAFFLFYLMVKGVKGRDSRIL